MKKVFILLSAIIVLSCSSKKQQSEEPEVGLKKVVALYILPDGSRALEALKREIKFIAKRDSFKKKNIFVYDTVWYLERRFPLVDKNNKPVLDSAGKPMVDTIPKYFPLIKDSVKVIWNIANKDVDSLLKKGYPVSNE